MYSFAVYLGRMTICHASLASLARGVFWEDVISGIYKLDMNDTLLVGEFSFSIFSPGIQHVRRRFCEGENFILRYYFRVRVIRKERYIIFERFPGSSTFCM